MLVSQVVNCSGSIAGWLPSSLDQPSSESGESILGARRLDLLRRTATRLMFSAPEKRDGFVVVVVVFVVS